MSRQTKVRILIVDDQEPIRSFLETTLNQVADFEVIATAETGESALDKASKHCPTVVVLDIGLPGIDGIETARRLRATCPEAHILMFTSEKTLEKVFGAFKAGADGYVLKGAPNNEVQQAIRVVAEGGAWLDPALESEIEGAPGKSCSDKGLGSK